MTIDVCLDANIFIASLTNEPNRDICLTLLRRLDEERAAFFEPALVVFEVGSNIQKKVFHEELKLHDAQQSLDAFFQMPLLLQWHDRIINKAAYFAQVLHLKNTYDCAYLAVAATRVIPFVTLDDEFAKKGQKVYKNIFSVDEFLKHL